ncbi:MAG: hypothetical protein ACKO9A_11760 [Alphaproteobacteria bacterium]
MAGPHGSGIDEFATQRQNMKNYADEHKRQGCMTQAVIAENRCELSNVNSACKMMGYSRQQFYEIRRNLQFVTRASLFQGVPRQRLWDYKGDLDNGGCLAHPHLRQSETRLELLCTEQD